MTALLPPRPVPAAPDERSWFRMGWTTDSREPRQYVHAVRPGRVIAACGVRIVCGGDRWPETVWAWDGPAPRCPRCSRVAYGLRPAPPV